MSTVALDGSTVVESPSPMSRSPPIFEISPGPVILVDGEPAAQPPISPSSASNLLQLAMSSESLKKIALGLITNIKQREREVAAYDTARNEHVAWLERELHRIQQTAPSTPRIPPQEDYVLNTDQAPGFYIPVEEGLWQPAYWVKLLPDGRCAGLLKDDGPEAVPYIADLFAQADYNPSDPDLPLPCWLLQLLAGAPTYYQVIRQEVEKIGDWAIIAEVTRYRNLTDHIKTKQAQIMQMEKDLKVLDEQRDLCEARLARTCFEDKVSVLCSLSGPRDKPRFRKIHRPKKRRLPTLPNTAWRPHTDF